MPWQIAQYYETQRRTLRPGTFTRLHENRWATASAAFLTAEAWNACTDPTWSEMWPTRDPEMFVGVDAGIKHDSAAVVAVVRDEDQIVLATHRIWRPSSEAPLDLEQTIEAYLRDLHQRYRLADVLCDPYQMHRSMTTLKAAGLPIREYPQTSGNLTRMAEVLFTLVTSRALVVYPAPELREQVIGAVAMESSRGWKITKERASRKVDAVVALSMACVAALDAPVLEPVRIW